MAKKAEKKQAEFEPKNPATPEQIAAWKESYGNIYEVPTEDGRVIYLRKPSKDDLLYAASVGSSSNLAFNEAVAGNCIIGGDMELFDDPGAFVVICNLVDTLVEPVALQIKKL